MASAHEIEIKLPVRDAAGLKERLRRAGFERVEPRRREMNLLFDDPEARLRRARCLLRLRTERGRSVLTFKGAPLASRHYKVRAEHEAEIADGEEFQRILEGLGLRETFRYEKFRTTYARPRERGKHRGGLLEWDETPIGDFIELEGPRRWIDQVARALGFARRDYVTASYAALYFAKCRSEGLRPSNMVFRRRR